MSFKTFIRKNSNSRLRFTFIILNAKELKIYKLAIDVQIEILKKKCNA